VARELTELQKLAKGQRCYIGCPECSFDPARVVLCHIRRGNVAGVGQKPPDLIALPGCDICNAISDGGMKSAWSRTEVDSAILKGWAIWMNKLINDEIVLVCI
jgi:hypothetical protein